MNELTTDDDKAMQANKANMVCCLCGQPIVGYGHNPDTSLNRLGKPRSKERCCDRCDYEVVTPARLGLPPRGLGTLEDWQVIKARVDMTRCF